MDRLGIHEVKGVIAFIGVGSNMGDPVKVCVEAIKRIAETTGILLLRRSSLYRTEPVGVKEQAWFINAVIEVRTNLAPGELLMSLKAIEQVMGRTKGPRWGPRIIDLDVLFYGSQVFKEQGLIIPHPELHRRAFVLIPLGEIASYVIHPAFGISVGGLLDRLQDPSRVEKWPSLEEM